MIVAVAGVQNKTTTGTVTIYDGATPLTTLNLGGDGKVYWYISPGLAAGTHQISAAYSGDANNPGGKSAPVTVTVSAVPTNLGAACWNSSLAYGQNYSCAVNVSSNGGAVSGAITYTLDSTGSVTVPLTNGSAQFTISQPVPGNHSLSIQYLAQGSFGASQVSNQSFTVSAAPVVENVSASSYWAHQGTPITLSVTLSSWSAGAPAQGSVSFYDNGVVLGTVPVSNNGTVSFATSSLVLGQHSIQASFFDLPEYASTTNSLNLTIAQ